MVLSVLHSFAVLVPSLSVSTITILVWCLPFVWFVVVMLTLINLHWQMESVASTLTAYQSELRSFVVKELGLKGRVV